MKNSLQLKEGMTADVVVSMFNKAVKDFINQSSRVPARYATPKHIEAYAKNLFNEIKHLIHPCYLEPYLIK